MKVKRNVIGLSLLSALAICLSTTTGATSLGQVTFFDSGYRCNGTSTVTGCTFTATTLSTPPGTGGTTENEMGLVLGGTPAGAIVHSGTVTIGSTDWTFGSPAFGTFTTTSLTQVSNTSGASGSRIFEAPTGTWTAGTAFPTVVGQTFPASLIPPAGVSSGGLAFFRFGSGAGAAIIGEYTMTAEAAPIPEPASLGMLLTGVAGLVVSYRRRHRPLTRTN